MPELIKTAPRRIAFVLSELGHGGIGRVTVLLTKALVSRGFAVDLVLGRVSGPFVPMVDAGVRIIALGSTHPFLSLPPLVRYLWRSRPDLVVCDKLRVNLAVLRAGRLARYSPPVFATIHGVLSHKLEEENLSDRKKARKYRDIHRTYPHNAGFIAVSSGIADDLIDRHGVPRERVHVVHNPIVTAELFQQAAAPVDHPWFSEDDTPVVVGVGRLEPQKDFATLVQAFASLRERIACRLLILGEGSERGALKAQIERLGLAEHVLLPGFVRNPFAYVARSRVFVLSSRWEGFGNVIVEALALGTPVVSTDCPAGPAEILERGRFGRLVPPGDSLAMADAIEAALREPMDPAVLAAEGARYTPDACAGGYLRAFGWEVGGDAELKH